MLERIELYNYRCFRNSKMSIRDLAIIVGKNNAGKSSTIEALRLISMASKMCTKTSYIDAPSDLELPRIVKGFRLPVENLKIDLSNAVYYYQQERATITAYYKNKVRIVVYINGRIAFATIIDEKNNYITTKGKAARLNIGSISILPQIGLIKKNEKPLSEKTVVEDVDTYLSSRHFRNEMLLEKDEYFAEFKKMAEETWPGLIVDKIEYNSFENEYINLFVTDSGFPSEIGLMGSGIQMWLQIIWFICRSKSSETIILDEPDIYMHPELQVKILKLVKTLFKQVIIATHSIEIISNVSPRNIVTIEKKNRQMRYADDVLEVQNAIDDIGSQYNLSLTKLNSSNKCILVEGDDIKILQKFYDILNPSSTYTIDTIPHLPIGGFKRIKESYGLSNFFYKNSGNLYKCFAILDSDYYIDSNIDEEKDRATENHLILHIWSKKEIENYIIVPNAIYRIIQSTGEEYNTFLKKYEELIDTFKDTIIDAYTTMFQENDRGLTAGKAASMAREYVNTKWADLDSKLCIVPGKQALRATNKWIKDNYEISCSMERMFKEMRPEDIDPEVIEVIETIAG